MQRSVRLAAILLGCSIFCSPAHAASPRGTKVGLLVLPARRPAGPALDGWSREVTRSLARRVSGSVVTLPPPAREVDVERTLARARELEASGALDEAAATYDAALDVVIRSPQRLRDADLFVASMVSRASIALARGETSRAEEILERLLRYDPGFALTAAEKRPSMKAAVVRVRARVGDLPPFEAGLVGDACQGADLLVVVRARDRRSVELRLLDRCRLAGSRVVQVSTPAAEAASALRQGGTPSITAGADGKAPARPAPRPLYKRTWFWIAVGAVVTAAVAGAVVAATVNKEEGVEVVPHW